MRSITAVLAGLVVSTAAPRIAHSATEGFWVAPLERLTLRAESADEHDRPYSLPARRRDVAGEFALSCEYQEGRPCGDGVGLGAELDSGAGWGRLLSAGSRVRLWDGTDRFGHVLELDRAWLRLEYGVLLLQIGRDVLTLGPATRAGLMISRNAAPQDGLRAAVHDVRVTPWLKIYFFYFLDRLRDPQTFRGTLLDGTRGELEFFDHVRLGGTRLLMLGGEGAPDYGGFWGFVEEHFWRTRETSAGTAENNRLSFDLAVNFPAVRVYYEIAFEDTRKRFWNMVQYDADHLIGLELRGRSGALHVELEHTGWVSQEHGTFRTGMTNSGRTFGSAMGPDGTSLWVKADLRAGPTLVSPWVEWMRFVSDRYGSDQDRGVFVIATGPMEHRQRIGADFEAQLAPHWSTSGGIFGERIGNADLIPGNTQYSVGARAALTFTP